MGFLEAGVITIDESHKLTTTYTNILTTTIFNNDCRRWDEKLESDKTWKNLKIHFAAPYRQHRKMHGETSASSGYKNAAVVHPEEYLTESLGTFSNLASSTAVDHDAVATITEENAHFPKHLEYQAKSLK